MRERVIVTTKSGASFAGLLYATDRQVLVLREATQLGGREHLPVDGELIVLWAEVDYLQRP